MNLPWYYYIIYVVVGTALLSVLDKYKIIKSKRLRYFIFIVVYTLACWGIYDLVLAPK